jgi:hypothetical protein
MTLHKVGSRPEQGRIGSESLQRFTVTFEYPVHFTEGQLNRGKAPKSPSSSSCSSGGSA